jgi:hypothetical protein
MAAGPHYIASAQTAQRTLPFQQFFYCCVHLLQPLPSNSCCIAAYFTVVAYQWVYMPQYNFAGVILLERIAENNECVLKSHVFKVLLVEEMLSSGMYYHIVW